MTKINYLLSNGEVVTSYAEAKASGLAYKAIYKGIKEEPNIFKPLLAKRLKAIVR